MEGVHFVISLDIGQSDVRLMIMFAISVMGRVGKLRSEPISLS